MKLGGFNGLCSNRSCRHCTYFFFVTEAMLKNIKTGSTIEAMSIRYYKYLLYNLQKDHTFTPMKEAKFLFKKRYIQM